jgi:signal transduction histidine kinase
MGDRTLQARLTRRLLVVAGVVLLAVGAAAVVVTDRVLDAGDEAQARAHAVEASDALRRELAEGDPVDQALGEVVAEHAQGGRLTVRGAGVAPRAAGDELPELSPGACATLEGAGGPWRACAVAGPGVTMVAAVSMAAHKAAVATLARGMLAVVLAALLALWAAVRRALRAPIAELTALVGWTKRIVDEERAVAPPPSESREIVELEAAFDALVRRLLDALVRERANSAHIAHELRTPLTAIVTELDGLRVDGDASRAAVARVRSDVSRLATVIDAILVLSESRPGAAGAGAIINVADLVREAAPSGARVEAPDEALVEGDEHLVALALRNLVDNATKYGAGARSMRVSRDGAEVRVAVVDGGPGLDEGARARMFDRYWRGSADGDGSGLGLALVRAVAERHGGRAEAQPGPAGKGLEVSLTLGGLVGWHEAEPSASVKGPLKDAS